MDPALKSGTIDEDLKKYMREEYEPKDLGPEVYEILKKEHKEKRQVFTRDYMVLFDFYKLLKKSVNLFIYSFIHFSSELIVRQVL